MVWNKIPAEIQRLIRESKGRPKIIEAYKDFDTAMRNWNRWFNRIEKTYGVKYDIVYEEGKYRLRIVAINEKQLMFATLKYS